MGRSSGVLVSLGFNDRWVPGVLFPYAGAQAFNHLGPLVLIGLIS